MTRTLCPIHNAPTNGWAYYRPREGITTPIPACSRECLNEIARNPHRYREKAGQ